MENETKIGDEYPFVKLQDRLGSIQTKIDAIKFIREAANVGLAEGKLIVEKIQDTKVIPQPVEPRFDFSKARNSAYNALDCLNAIAMQESHELNIFTASNLARDIEIARKHVSKVLQTLEKLRSF